MISGNRVVIYTRVSTDRQHADNQNAQLEAMIAAKGWQVVKRFTEQETAWKAGHPNRIF